MAVTPPETMAESKNILRKRGRRSKTSGVVMDMRPTPDGHGNDDGFTSVHFMLQQDADTRTGDGPKRTTSAPPSTGRAEAGKTPL